MSTALIVLLVVLAVVVLALAAAAFALPQRRSRRLQQQFGPEYQRALTEHEGDAKAAERDLDERVKQTGELDLHPLEAAQQERFRARWSELQAQFVDAPAQSVQDADLLLSEVLRERGYPDDGQDAALSVHHAEALDSYRSLRSTAVRARTGEAGTEELRQAFAGARDVFDQVVSAGTGDVPARPRRVIERTSR